MPPLISDVLLDTARLLLGCRSGAAARPET